MSPEERQLLAGLFERIGSTATAPRDREAEAVISDAVRAQPHAPYVMAQTVIVQEEALKAAAARIQELEARNAELERSQSQSGSFLGGFGKSLFGDGARRSASGIPLVGAGQPVPQGGVWGGAPIVQPQTIAPQRPWGAPAMGGPTMGGPMSGVTGMGAPAGGGFLRSAMATAAGVAGGALLFSGIQSLMNSHGSGLLPVDHAAAAGDVLSSPALTNAGLDDPNPMMGGRDVSGDDQGYDVAATDSEGDFGGSGDDWA